MADEGPRPGGTPSLMGNVTVSFYNANVDEAIASGERYRSVMEAILASSTQLAEAAPVRSLARDTDLAREAADAVHGVYDRFSRALIAQGGNFEELTSSQRNYLRLAQNGTQQLLAAYQRYADANEEGALLDQERYEQLLKRNRVFRELGDVLERVKKSSEEYNSEFKDFKKDLSDINEKALPAFTSAVTEAFKEIMPKNLGDSTKAMNALTKGFDVGRKGLKRLMGVAGKALSVLGKKALASKDKGLLTDLVSKGTMGKATQGVSGLGKAAAKAGPLVTQFGAALARMGPIGLVAIAVIGAIVVAMTPLILAFGALVAGIKLGILGIQKITQMQEEYRKTIYRSVGTISELNLATAEMNRLTGLGTEAAIESVKAMVDAGISAQTLANGIKDANGELVRGPAALAVAGESLMKFASMTGVSASEAAKLQKIMLELSDGTDDGVIAFAEMTAAQERFGLSNKDLSDTMGLTTKMLSAFEFGLKGTNVNKFTKTILEMQGAAKQAGLSVKVATDFIDQMVNKVDDSALKIAAFSGRLNEYLTTSSADTMAEIGAEGLKNMESFLSRASGGSQAMFQLMAKSLGVTTDQLKMMKSYQDMMSAGQKKLFKEEQARNELNKKFGESMRTLSMQLKQIFEPLIAMASEAVAPFVEELMKMGDFLKEAVMPLWIELQLLLENIFGVKFGNSGNLKAFLKAAIGALTEVVRWANTLWDWIKKIISWVDMLADAWNSWLKYVVIGVLLVTNPMAAAVVIGAGLLSKLSDMSESATNRAKRRAELETKHKKEQLDQQLKDAAAANQKHESQADKYLKRLRERQSGGPGFVDDVLREAYRERGYDPDKIFGAKNAVAKMTPTKTAASATAAIAKTSPASPEVVAVQDAVETAMMPTAKHTEDMKTSNTGKITDLINRIEESNVLLAMIYEKSDPNTETMAEVMKEMASQKSSYKSHRRSPVMGSVANQWGGENS